MSILVFKPAMFVSMLTVASRIYILIVFTDKGKKDNSYVRTYTAYAEVSFYQHQHFKQNYTVQLNGSACCSDTAISFHYVQVCSLDLPQVGVRN